jgi:hypothetical protein
VRTMADYGKLKQLTDIVDTLISYDLEKLRREDAVERVGYYNQIIANEHIVENEILPELPIDIKEYTLGQFTFAKLQLAAAEQINNENTGIMEHFNSRELSLVATFDQYNAFDIRTPEELSEKMRRGRNICNLAQEYQNEYKRLDSILDDSEIRKDLKVFLKKQYKERLKNVNEGIQFYIGKYGPKDFFERLGNVGSTANNGSSVIKPIDNNKVEKQKLDQADQKQKRAEKLKQITEAADGKPMRFIYKEDARKCELDFIARFDTKMNQFPLKVYTPIEKKTFEIRNWKEGEHVSKSERSTPDMPWNTRSLYVVQENKFGIFGEKIRKVAIEAVSFNHLDEFEHFGIDSQPANITELLSLVTSLIDTAELGKYLHIIGISSPTGWVEKLTEEFKSSGLIRNYISRFVSFCLIDPVTGELFYNTSDERIVRLSEFFKPEFDHEKIDKVTKYVLDRLPISGYVVFEDVIKETNESRKIANKVFYDLQKEGKYRVRQIKDIGLVLQTND